MPSTTATNTLFVLFISKENQWFILCVKNQSRCQKLPGFTKPRASLASTRMMRGASRVNIGMWLLQLPGLIKLKVVVTHARRKWWNLITGVWLKINSNFLGSKNFQSSSYIYVCMIWKGKLRKEWCKCFQIYLMQVKDDRQSKRLNFCFFFCFLPIASSNLYFLHPLLIKFQ